ncbi:hypothetical protein HYU14_01005 [Candidatus Woesearchaeota archaeon]|nr:hypothetical protein [Candidatus Woesearchaeota archaeon]
MGHESGVVVSGYPATQGAIAAVALSSSSGQLEQKVIFESEPGGRTGYKTSKSWLELTQSNVRLPTPVELSFLRKSFSPYGLEHAFAGSPFATRHCIGRYPESSDGLIIAEAVAQSGANEFIPDKDKFAAVPVKLLEDLRNKGQGFIQGWEVISKYSDNSGDPRYFAFPVVGTRSQNLGWTSAAMLNSESLLPWVVGGHQGNRDGDMLGTWNPHEEIGYWIIKGMNPNPGQS